MFGTTKLNEFGESGGILDGPTVKKK